MLDMRKTGRPMDAGNETAWKEGRKELFYPYGKTYAQTLGEQD